MIPAPHYRDIKKIINGEGRGKSFPSKARTVGFVIFNQNFDNPSLTNLIQNLDILNKHSGSYIHFFLCGVSRFGPNNRLGRELGELEGVTLYHNVEALYSFVEALEREIENWSYDLGFDLVLVDIVDIENESCLDFSSTVFFKIDELIKIGIIDSPSELFGKLVKFAKNGNFSSANEFRNKLRQSFGVHWVKALILAIFPKAVGQLARTEAVLGGGASIPE